jgi:hypothetical protein
VFVPGYKRVILVTKRSAVIKLRQKISFGFQCRQNNTNPSGIANQVIHGRVLN